MKLHLLRRPATALFAALLVPACGGGGGGGGGAPAPFQVIFRSPAADATNVARTAIVYVKFSRAADPTTVTETNFFLTSAGNPVPAAVSYSACNFMASLTPSAPLGAAATCTVNLTSALTDTGGAPLAPETFSFTTGNFSDTTLPTFSGVSSATAASATSVNLSWSAATGESSPVVYDIFVSTTSGCFNFGDPDQTTPAGATGATVTGLVPNTTYYFAVRARDAEENSDRNTVQASAKTLVSWSLNVWPVVQNNCRSCHVSGQGSLQVPNMIMTDATATRAAWINVDPSCTGGSIPAGAKRVVPGDPAQSFVYNKISQVTPWCGDRMPRGQPALSPVNIQLFFDWIDQGALDN
ncbi:MAG: Ig-like domain-containing protein [Planctomycetota bacterium]